MFDVAGAMIAQKMIELCFRFWNIVMSATINDVNVFPCMRVVEAKMMLFLGRIAGQCVVVASK